MNAQLIVLVLLGPNWLFPTRAGCCILLRTRARYKLWEKDGSARCMWLRPSRR